MKFSENWLREYVDPDIDLETLTHQLTMAGLEVDGVEKAYPEFEGLVIAEVKSVAKHPNADKLKVCEVDIGEADLLTVVCGANNVKQGMRTVLAKTGAKLPDKPPLEATELKGVLSNGMLCSAKEIGLGDDNEGIIELSNQEKVGKSLSEIVSLNDNLIEVSLTPNRGDCLSIIGIARELGVINQKDINVITPSGVKENCKSTRNIKISEPEACPRYVGRVIENVDASVPSPLWLREKLRCSGVRSINIIVDITNLVMLEIGQPMHAFDNDLLQGVIHVRHPESGEKIRLLDESEHEIKQNTLLITDESGPIAMAGLMGGMESAVTSKTGNIFLESAFFKPEVIIGEARQYGMHTDSSHRFERGVDPELQKVAIERASELILSLCGGNAGPIHEVTSEEKLPQRNSVNLRKKQVLRVLGINLSDEFIENTFKRLGMEVEISENQWLITPPSYRFDINIEADLIEELARIHSYDAIPAISPSHTLKIRDEKNQYSLGRRLKDILINRDYQEVITYSFIDPEYSNLLNSRDITMVLENPIASELSEMRKSLWPGLLNCLQYNKKRQFDRIRLFEMGMVFNGNEELQQEQYLGGIIYGNNNKKQWNKDDIVSDFYSIKADIEVLLKNRDYKLLPVELKFLHPGQAMEIYIDNKKSGYFGALHPSILASSDLDKSVYLFEINMVNMLDDRQIQFQSISRFPAVKRDISIVVDEKIAYEDIKKCINEHVTDLLNNLELFDVYQGEGIEKGKKSLALGLTFRATSSTLKDGEVEAIMEKVIDGLNNKFGAKLRE